MGLVLDLRVESEDWQTIDALEPLCQRALEAGFTQETIASAHVDVLLTDDAHMEALNTTWRGKPKPTDVLSFPAGENPENFLGDIAVGYGVAHRDAAKTKTPLPDHLSHLLIHGLLHLLGHDHIEDDAAEIMENLERVALGTLGINDPYSRIINK